MKSNLAFASSSNFPAASSAASPSLSTPAGGSTSSNSGRTSITESGDSYGSIFEPDALMPGQFYGIPAEGQLAAEKRLMAACLADGIENYLSGVGAKSGERTDAFDWVERRDPNYVFSFDSVCNALGIDAEYLRQGLFRYAERMRSGALNDQWKKIRRPRK